METTSEWKVSKSKLSDGSFVYDIRSGKLNEQGNYIVINTTSKEQAEQLVNLLNRTSGCYMEGR